MAQMYQDWSQNVVENRSNNNAGGGGAGGGGKKKRRPRKSKASDAQKAEAEETDFAVKKVDLKFSVALQRARIAKGLKQDQLAAQLSVHKTMVNQYESGKAVPSSDIIAKMNRILGTKLPPVNPPKKKRKRKKKTNTGPK